MKIVFSALGTRGDIEPFLSQAEIFSEAGHEIVCLFPEQFREKVSQLGYKFLGFDRRFLELIDSQSGKNIMGGGGSAWNQFKNYIQLAKSSMSLQQILIDQQRDVLLEEKPDRVIFHAKCLYYFVAAMARPDQFTFLTPLPCLTHPTEEFPHIGLGKWKPFGKKLNLFSYRLVNGARRLTMKKFLKKHYSDFPDLKINSTSLRKFEEEKLETVYTISPTLFPKPGYWPKSAHIVGYFFRNQMKSFLPDPNLEKWLKKYSKAILITFGSMGNPKPKEHSATIIHLLQKHKIPAIVNLSWGGLEKIEGTDESIFYVDQIPYEWILPKLYGIIHHGGSGTTHHGAAHGCVQMIMPHIIDQYFWNRIIVKRGLGPLGPSIHDLDEVDFERALLDFWQNPTYKSTAKTISDQLKQEAPRNFVLDLVLNRN
ncbi:glycosyltransferase [Algoriphagus halophytocola]|uniref:Glycosyltransferase n=1 Tax=Algoriphagus halophytocola TaxID=2991499 RepID=A0ABY6MIK1_9BACT|nr:MULTISPECIES: glycosyltransferase [unclassified Algoriphagus]UZD23616.1 glycosyltransferase [Algoriphagus sp. TR-M5]WBL44909.1 glycosyltransferase [Algoriphagus sp. TR-M9]